MSLRLRYMKLSDLEARPGNPKRHDEAQLAASVDRFGFADPVAINENDGALVEGHGRVEHLSRLKSAGNEPPQHVKVAKDGEWMVPVVRGLAFADENEARAYVIAHNRIGESLWDNEALSGWMKSLDDGQVEVNGLGFDATELAELLRDDSIEAITDTEPRLGDLEYRVFVVCESERAQDELCELLQKAGYQPNRQMV